MLKTSVVHLSVSFWGAIALTIALAFDARALGPWLLPTAALGLCLAAVMIFDARYLIIPDQLIMIVSIVGLGSTALLTPDTIITHLWLAVVAYLTARGINAVYRAVRGREGLGHGDAKLLAACACWLDPHGLASALLCACASALLSVAILQLRKKNIGAQTAVPLGTHIAFAVWATWALGPLILHLG